MGRTVLAVIACVMAFITNPYVASATDLVINPANDGRIFWNGVIFKAFNGLDIYDSSQGIIKFSTNLIVEPISHASLSVNPYALPLYCKNIAVYGYQSSNSQITSSDFNAGIFLGNWSLPNNLGYGQDAFFDVTQFMQGVSSPFVSFNLRSINGLVDNFSCLAHNYGHPSQLAITPIPEPATLLLLGVGGILVRKW